MPFCTTSIPPIKTPAAVLVAGLLAEQNVPLNELHASKPARLPVLVYAMTRYHNYFREALAVGYWVVAVLLTIYGHLPHGYKVCVFKCNKQQQQISSLPTDTGMYMYVCKVNICLFMFSDVFTPSFVELTTTNHAENIMLLRQADVRFPFGKLVINTLHALNFVIDN